MKKGILTFAVAMAVGVASAAEKDYTQYVNTLQGTDSNFGLAAETHILPPACLTACISGRHRPGKNGDGFKYTYGADAIRGFAQAHQVQPLGERLRSVFVHAHGG